MAMASRQPEGLGVDRGSMRKGGDKLAACMQWQLHLPPQHHALGPTSLKKLLKNHREYKTCPP